MKNKQPIIQTIIYSVILMFAIYWFIFTEEIQKPWNDFFAFFIVSCMTLLFPWFCFTSILWIEYNEKKDMKKYLNNQIKHKQEEIEMIQDDIESIKKELEHLSKLDENE